LRLAKRGKTAGSNKAIINIKRSRWQAVTAFCGNVPLQVPPLELSELFAGWQNGGVKQSNKQYKAVTVICCDRLNIYAYCGNYRIDT